VSVTRSHVPSLCKHGSTDGGHVETLGDPGNAASDEWQSTSCTELARVEGWDWVRV